MVMFQSQWSDRSTNNTHDSKSSENFSSKIILFTAPYLAQRKLPYLNLKLTLDASGKATVQAEKMHTASANNKHG